MREDFPPEGAIVNDAISRASSVVAGGSVSSPTPDCPEHTDAALWYWRGDGWQQAPVEDTDDGTVKAFVRSPHGWGLHAVGSEGMPCWDGRAAIWGASDKSDWYRLQPLTGLDSARSLNEAVFTGQRVVATGWSDDADLRMGIWITAPDRWDMEWRLAKDRPPSYFGGTLVQLGALGDVAIGFESYRGQPVWLSDDGGDHWRNAPFRVPYGLETTASVSDRGLYVVAGSACCTRPGKRAGVILASPDGENWTSSTPLALPTVPREILFAGGFFIALGEETYLSQDGLAWTLGPALPGYDGESNLVAANNDSTLFVVGADRTWLLPLEELGSHRWSEPVLPARMPEVGDAYDYSLYTHCGPENATIRFDLRSWVAEAGWLVDGQFPPGFDDPEQPGPLTYAAPDRLEFETPGGGVFPYVPSDTPPDTFPCA